MKRPTLLSYLRRASRVRVVRAREGHALSRRLVVGIACLTVALGSLVAVSGPSAGVGTGEANRQRTESRWLTVSSGGLHTCGIRPDHTLWCWGRNAYGQLGLGDTRKRTTPKQVGTGTHWAGLATGFEHTCATRADHSLWCWGFNDFGQLGLGDTRKRTTPKQVGTGTNWAHVSAGYGHTCGTRTNHTLWCWGLNSFAGQLGVGDNIDRETPTRVGTRTNWADVRTGDSHTCGTRTNHTLWCWGYNASGQLGLGDTANRTSPTQVGSRTDWARVSAGDGYHTCAIRTDHTVWCWGFNGVGELGVGDTVDRSTPTQVGYGSDWYHLSAGHKQTCATRSDRTLWCWGLNNFGQLGLGDTTDRTTPTQVGTRAGWAHVSAGGSLHTCATRSNHSLWCWGYNHNGQLGLGNQEDRWMPARV